MLTDLFEAAYTYIIQYEKYDKGHDSLTKSVIRINEKEHTHKTTGNTTLTFPEGCSSHEKIILKTLEEKITEANSEWNSWLTDAIPALSPEKIGYTIYIYFMKVDGKNVIQNIEYNVGDYIVNWRAFKKDFDYLENSICYTKTGQNIQRILKVLSPLKFPTTTFYYSGKDQSHPSYTYKIIPTFSAVEGAFTLTQLQYPETKLEYLKPRVEKLLSYTVMKTENKSDIAKSLKNY
jgi:hypothetical protein